jgi:hypothetical protein
MQSSHVFCWTETRIQEGRYTEGIEFETFSDLQLQDFLSTITNQRNELRK